MAENEKTRGVGRKLEIRRAVKRESSALTSNARICESIVANGVNANYSERSARIPDSIIERANGAACLWNGLPKVRLEVAAAQKQSKMAGIDVYRGSRACVRAPSVKERINTREIAWNRIRMQFWIEAVEDETRHPGDRIGSQQIKRYLGSWINDGTKLGWQGALVVGQTVESTDSVTEILADSRQGGDAYVHTFDAFNRARDIVPKFIRKGTSFPAGEKRGSATVAALQETLHPDLGIVYKAATNEDDPQVKFRRNCHPANGVFHPLSDSGTTRRAGTDYPSDVYFVIWKHEIFSHVRSALAPLSYDAR
ncbi:hypothetical protein K0M31_003603 [Melipona bicolor]|uniref:Uncharacterized protein n=1 Tax=Melipona bicolor TaxID=60889 RepID=A0AA40FZC5_9HYME|nr:hypothetical protein K0M31_003603 [Melipona bicolor]